MKQGNPGEGGDEEKQQVGGEEPAEPTGLPWAQAWTWRLGRAIRPRLEITPAEDWPPSVQPRGVGLAAVFVDVGRRPRPRLLLSQSASRVTRAPDSR